MGKLKILIISGTARAGDETSKIALYLHGYLEGREDVTFSYFDIHTVAMKLRDEATIKLPEYEKLVIEADGFLIVSPEYNHGYPGSLKMILDLLHEEYDHKPLGICGVSGGILGGARMVEQLNNVARELYMIPIKKSLYAPMAHDFFGEDGKPRDERFNGRTDRFMDELVKMTKTMKWGRENIFE